MVKYDHLNFLQIRDRHQRSGVGYRHYTEMIGDSALLHHLFPDTFFGLEIGFPESFRILDICCGPGMAGMAIDNELRKYGYDVREVVFVDVEEDRLKEIPFNPRYRVIRADVLSFLQDLQTKSEDEKPDIIVLRNAIYYFRNKERRRLFDGIKNSLPDEKPGCFIFSSYGFTEPEGIVLTRLHRRIFMHIFSSPDLYRGRGCYDGVVRFCEKVEKHGMGGPIMDMGNVTFTTRLLADKYGLSEEAKQDIEKLLESLPKRIREDVNLRKVDDGVAFDVNSYTYEFLKYMHPVNKIPQQDRIKRTANVRVENATKQNLFQVLDRFLISRASELNLFFSGHSYREQLTEVIDHYGSEIRVKSERTKGVVIERVMW